MSVKAKPLRLNAFVAKSIGCSRRQADKLIKSGQIFFNGTRVKRDQIGIKVSVGDIVEFQGKTLSLPSLQYGILNKPAGYTTTLKDRFAKRIVMDLLPDEYIKLKPVGRLDKDTRGLLLFTDDGEIIHKLLHPKYGITKEYLVKVKGRLPIEAIAKIESGFEFPDFKGLPCKARVERASMNHTVVRLFMKEGKKRQIRRMFALLGYPVIDLLRVAFGPIRLGRLKEGEFRLLRQREIEQLKKMVERR